ncbi:hypothetical protein C0J52_17563 [Blattella germanica]|nr:hypothetical protein C0J52_17563 [Blattella germanica]
MLKNADIKSIRIFRLRWVGHVRRMEVNRDLRRIFYYKFEGKRRLDVPGSFYLLYIYSKL